MVGSAPSRETGYLVGLAPEGVCVFLNGALGNLHADFEQFTANAFRTPERVVADHLLDEGDGRLLQSRSTLRHV